MMVRPLDIPDVWVVTPRRFGDARGWFSEVYAAATWAAHGIDLVFVQDNHSFSAEPGTLRGLHYQAPPYAQAKLVRVARGSIFDVAVDLRQGSATYGRWVGTELSATNGQQVLIPEGFAHGFLTLEPDCEVLYKCTAGYAPRAEGGLRWDDHALGISWPPEPTVSQVSERDRNWPGLAEFESPFVAQAGGARR